VWPTQIGQADVQLQDAWLHCIVSDSNAGQMCMYIGKAVPASCAAMTARLLMSIAQ